MPLYVRNRGTPYTPAPEGLHAAVCVDVVDLGLLQTQWGKKHKVELRWQIDETMEDGKPFLVVKRYTASLHPKSKLRSDLESWRGRAMTEDEATEFDLEKLLSANCLVNIVHRPFPDGGVFAGVNAVIPGRKGQRLAPRQYTRICDQPGYKAPLSEEDPAGPADSAEIPEDDIPF